MRGLVRIVVSIFSICLSAVCIADTYLCVADKSVGFKLSDDWAVVNFNVTKTKMIFRRVKPNEKDALGRVIPSAYVAYEFDNEFLNAEFNGCSPNKNGNLYFCNIWGTEYIFNKQERLFQSVDRLGYVLQKDKDFKSDVALTIGKCAKVG